MDKAEHEGIIGWPAIAGLVTGKTPSYKINDESSDLRLQDVKIVGNDYEKSSNTQADPILPEIFVQGPQVFHERKIRESGIQIRNMEYEKQNR